MPDLFTKEIRIGKVQNIFKTRKKRCFKTKKVKHIYSKAIDIPYIFHFI